MTGENDVLREEAPAKLNLTLRVVGRRPDGYHLLDSVVAFTRLGDTLELRPGGHLSLTADGPFAAGLPLTDNNLIVRAASHLATTLERRPAVSFRLTKRLPAAAGIGGGSADAAAALRLLARFWSLPPDDQALQSVAVQIGADVPVCLRSRRSHMSGIGDVVSALPPEDASPVVLANPGVALSTADVFRALKLPRRQLPDTEPNDLMAPAVSLAPQIADVLAAIRTTVGCRTVAMSGSGPTCFGIFETLAQANAAATQLKAAHPPWWVAATQLLD